MTDMSFYSIYVHTYVEGRKGKVVLVNNVNELSLHGPRTIWVDRGSYFYDARDNSS